MSGILYGVGVGPGDPELMTLKAARIIKEVEYLALPGKNPRETRAFTIAAAALPGTENKKLIALDSPMTKDEPYLKKVRRKNADILESVLDTGADIAYLTLGDISIYSTFSYLQKIVSDDGYRVEGISGVASFCAAAASLGIPLAEGDTPLHIVTKEKDVYPDGTTVIMKCGREAGAIKNELAARGFKVSMVENCSLADEKKYGADDDFPESSGYFSLIIAEKN